MAQRTTVLAPGNRPRATQVVRAGPPKGPRARRDGIIGAIGAVLLVAAGILVPILPEDPVVLPQYQLAFTDTSYENGTQRLILAEGETRDFVYDVVGANVSTIFVTVGFTDDFAASAPDRFLVELLNVTGATVHKVIVENEPAETPETPIVGALQGGYVAKPFEATFTYKHRVKPTDLIVEAERPSETAADVEDRLAGQFTGTGAGTWRLRVTLLEAGDCRTDDRVPANACAQDPSQATGADDGNPFSVTRFTYSRYEGEATSLAQ